MDWNRSLTLYFVPTGDGCHAIVTDHGETVVTFNKPTDLRAAHTVAEVHTGAMVRLVSATSTVARVTGQVFLRPTDDHDDPTLDRLTRMISG